MCESMIHLDNRSKDNIKKLRRSPSKKTSQPSKLLFFIFEEIYLCEVELGGMAVPGFGNPSS